MPAENVGHDNTYIDTNPLTENRIENRERNTNGSSSSPTSSDVDSIRESVRNSNRPVKGSCSVYIDLVTRQKLEQIAKELGTSFSGLVSVIFADYLKKLKSNTSKNPPEKTPSPEQQSHETLTQDNQKYLDTVAEEWHNRPQEWRDKQTRYIAKNLGVIGLGYLRNLVESQPRNEFLSDANEAHVMQNPDGLKNDSTRHS
jgi:hypothetical protein